MAGRLPLHPPRDTPLCLQEFIDSTQGMVKELHTVHGSVLARIGAIEGELASSAGSGAAASSAAAGGSGGALGAGGGALSEEAVRSIREDVAQLKSSMTVLQVG